jgi:hypothetical protein
MVAVASTALAGYLICLVLINLSLGDASEGLTIILELLFLVAPRGVG